jgi:hypothetical protein
MDQRVYGPHWTNGQDRPAVRVYLGKHLAKVVRTASPTERALMTVDMTEGRVLVERFTKRQAMDHTGANSRYAAIVRKLPALERAALQAGRLKLSHLANRRQPISNAKLDKLIEVIGPARVLDALDRITRPSSPVVPANNNGWPVILEPIAN